MANSLGNSDHRRAPIGACKFQPIGPRVNCETNDHDTYRANLRNIVAYLLKNAPQSALDGLDQIWLAPHIPNDKRASGGFVSGQRAGLSRQLSKAVKDYQASGPQKNPSKTHPLRMVSGARNC